VWWWERGKVDNNFFCVCVGFQVSYCTSGQSWFEVHFGGLCESGVCAFCLILIWEWNFFFQNRWRVSQKARGVHLSVPVFVCLFVCLIGVLWWAVHLSSISFIVKSDWGPDPDARHLLDSQCGSLYQDPFSQPLLFGRRGIDHLS